jgi:hemerythrin-like domain-containing protein
LLYGQINSMNPVEFDFPDPIKDMEREHGLIKMVLRVLEKVCEQLESGKPLNKEHMQLAITFIREFADKCHHGKEEALYFPAVRENNIPEEIALVDGFIEEHTIGRGFVKNMADAIESDDVSAFGENTKAYVKLLDQHIDRENEALFPMTEKTLSESKLKELDKGFEDVDKNVIGKERHEELHDIAYKLKEAYLQ